MDDDDGLDYVSRGFYGSGDIAVRWTGDDTGDIGGGSDEICDGGRKPTERAAYNNFVEPYVSKYGSPQESVGLAI